MTALRLHGGPGPDGPARWDFSSNGHPAGPCPDALAAVQAADPCRYPDPSHQALRAALGAFHGVDPDQVLIAASGSEFIQRISAIGARLAPGPVQVPPTAYGDYALAARAHGRTVVTAVDGPAPTLRWWAEPSSPLGRDAAPPAAPGACPTVLDCVYAPLRLDSTGRWTDADRAAAITLHSPGKALGLLGVRAAYALLPAADAVAWDVAAWRHALLAAEPSWPLGGQGVALLQAWCHPAVQQWLDQSRPQLRAWRDSLRQQLADRGVVLADSVTPFFGALLQLDAQALRRHGVAVRDAASFGLPGWVRLNALPPPAQAALLHVVDHARSATPEPAR
ncbi:aminotransferase class I/II-fold pyridoxal phosphate-dependent enzyme [Pseudaquabacterium pictum]|uniref:Aspartate aminotransferase n=1 Tax=Pseudaquabacterium pictum TaxID=2315236 RepID=A0A480ALV6_9BURK|nr:aminotransferase class I/II-fold pyridoxal phosphate-dependent enzyme [Rubrivivax pictus]GCL61387.1 aspartate aminotransferase [Rubrivivax pictus]